jgi:hypothetical protein
MTRDEFLTGWQLLVAQPWGRTYRSETSPRMAATQLEFYFRKLEKYPADMWLVAAEIFAGGAHWPSVEEMRTTLNNSLPKGHQSSDTSGTEPPEPIALGMAYAKANSVTFLEGMQAVLPKWFEQNTEHADRAQAEQWWSKFRRAKPRKSLRTIEAFSHIGKA